MRNYDIKTSTTRREYLLTINLTNGETFHLQCDSVKEGLTIATDLVYNRNVLSISLKKGVRVDGR